MTMTNAPQPADLDPKADPGRSINGLMSFKAFLRLNGGFGAAKTSEHKTD